MRLIAAYLLVLCAIAAPASAQDQKPKTLAEAKAEYEKTDQALNAAYATAKNELPDYEFEELRKDQREWIEYRDARVKEAMEFDHPEVAKGKEKQSPQYWETLKWLTETRLSILGGWRGVGDKDSWTGRYIDGYGGILEIVQEGGKLLFTFEVVRGPTAHMGFIAGEAKVNDTMARFSDAERAEKDKLSESGETWLTFVEDGRWLKVIGTNTHYYHGVRAYFDGQYMRVAALDEAQRAQVKTNVANPDWPLDEEEK